MLSPSLSLKILSICGLLLLISNVQGAGFSVKPTRIFLKDVPQAVLTVGNSGEEEVFVQTELMAWSQQDGKDIYTTSREVMVSPPMFKVSAGGEQTVRIRFTPNQAKLERTYRLFLQEVPQAKSEQSTLSTSLKMGVPIFIQPEKSDPAQFEWTALRSPNGLKVKLNNTTNSHIQITSLKLSTSVGKVVSDEKVFVYVLPGQAYSWDIKLNQPLTENRLLLQASSDRDEIKATIQLSESIVQ